MWFSAVYWRTLTEIFPTVLTVFHCLVLVEYDRNPPLGKIMKMVTFCLGMIVGEISCRPRFKRFHMVRP